MAELQAIAPPRDLISYSQRGSAMSLTLCLVVLVVGLLMFALAANPKIQRIGEIMFFSGLLALLLGADKVVALIHG